VIEWVPIKDWESDGKEPYLILIDCGVVYVVRDPYKHRPGLSWTYFYKNVTHAAKINFPVEKTLEEKFKEQYPWTIDACAKLAQIAKEHYEGENNG